jgi:predicted Fe-Mo cluster-binding NifX family protein
MKHVVLKVWNPKIRRELSDWIKKSGISGIICTEVCANFEDYLSRRDIWVKHAGSGDVQDLVEHWALSQEQQKGMPSIREAYNESETTLKPPHGGSQ